MDIIIALPGSIALGLIWGLLAIGLFISYKVLDVADLTVDGSICTGGAVATVFILNGKGILVALLFAFIAGLLCGLVTSLFTSILSIPPILSGILTQLMLWSINLKILKQSNKSLNPTKNTLLISSLFNTKSILIMLLITILIIAILYWFFGTEIGCAIRSSGNNEKMSKANGINTHLMKGLGLSISNGIIALSGALLCQYQGYCDINMGRGAIVIGLASIIIGTSLIKLFSSNFAFTLLGCSIGAIIYFIIYQIIIQLGFDTDLLKMLSAILVALFLGLPNIKKKISFNRTLGGKVC